MMGLISGVDKKGFNCRSYFLTKIERLGQTVSTFMTTMQGLYHVSLVTLKDMSLNTLVVYVWADQVGGGLKILCIKIGYNEPTGAESRERSSTLA